MMKARIVVVCKDDKTFAFVNGMLMKRFHKILYGKEDKMTSEDWKLRRKVVHLIKNITNFVNIFEKEFSEPVRTGKITHDFEILDKGGNVYLNLNGTEKEIEEWTKIRWRDKIGLLAVKKWVDIKVENLEK